MRWLPLISKVRQASRLPLSYRAALGLERALLAPSAEIQQRLFSELLERCPALAYWACCCEASAGAETIQNCTDAARWLAANLLVHIETLPEGDVWARPSESDADRIERSAAVAIELAVRSRNAADDDVDADHAYFAMLVYVGKRLLAGTANQTPSATSEVDPPAEPKWFAQVDAKLEQSEDGHSSWTTCIPQPRSEEECGPVEEGAGGGNDNVEGSGDDTVWHRLPLLIAKLQRLRQLEDEFEVQLEHEKIEAMKELAYGAGHEVNNPLANISARAQTLIKEETDPQRRRKLAAINSQAYRAHEMIADLMLFARPPELELATVDIGELLDQVVDELQPIFEERNISARCLPATGTVSVQADRVQLGVVLSAICKNSIEALGLGGSIELSVRSGADGWAEIDILDDGPGIDPVMRRHIFDPFYSGREAGRGLGFGLSKAWRIVTEHGGQITVDSQAGHGATFTIRLPKDPASSPEVTS